MSRARLAPQRLLPFLEWWEQKGAISVAALCVVALFANASMPNAGASMAVSRVVTVIAALVAVTDIRAGALLITCLPSLGVFRYHGTYLIPAAAWLGVGARFALGGRPFRLRLTLVDLAVAAFAIAAVLSIPFAISPAISLAALPRTLLMVATYLFLSRALTEKKTLKVVIVGAVSVACYSAVVALGQVYVPGFAIGAQGTMPDLLAPLDRAIGFSGNPNTLGLRLALGAVVCADRVLAQPGKRARLAWAAAFALLVFGVQVTHTRAAYVGLVVGMAGILFLRARPGRYFKQIAAFAVLAVAVALIATGTLGRAGSMLDPRNDPSSMDRVYLAAVSARMFADHPLTGIGLSGFANAYPAYADPRVTVSPVTDPHQAVLGLPAELGVGAIVAELLILAAIFSAMRRGRAFAADGDVPLFGPAFALALVFMCLFNTQQTTFAFWRVLAFLAVSMQMMGLTLWEREGQTPTAG